jgi:N-acetylglucosaminyldiphosphoundecaprenol N-acetyl-beta-D-mannosaminyltransferase
MDGLKKQKFLNTYVNNVNMDETISEIGRLITLRQKSYIVAINVDVVIKIENDEYLKKIVDNADMVLVDGKPLVWIAKLYKTPVKVKISGSDLIPLLCKKAAKEGCSIFILGGKDGVADKAKAKLEEQFANIKIVGTYAPPFGFEKNQCELDRINSIISAVKPDILITCFGCPKQEKFIYENIISYNATVSICAGATVDFLAGNVKRAPKWMSEHGLEWLYRFLQEPKRLFKRYFIDDLKILGLVWKYRKVV